MSAALQFALPKMPFMNRTGIAFWACMAVCAAVSLMTRPRSAEELTGLIWTRDSLRLPQEMREKMRGVRNPALWWAALTAVLLVIYVKYR